jgi:hypothetical protein
MPKRAYEQPNRQFPFWRKAADTKEPIGVLSRKKTVDSEMMSPRMRSVVRSAMRIWFSNCKDEEALLGTSVTE